MTEREAFEAWGGDQGYPLRRIHDEADQQYLDLRTQGAWEAWQAARAQPAQAVPLLSDDELWDLWNAQGCDDMNQVEASAFARLVEQAVRSKLGAEVLALRKDAERLDALESANVGSNMWITARGKDSFTVALKSPYGNCVTRKTLRDAIDAAIEAKRGEG